MSKQITLDQCKDHDKSAKMSASIVNYQLIEQFQITGKEDVEICNGRAIRIGEREKRYCQFSRSKRLCKRSLQSLKELSSCNPCVEEEEVDSEDNSSVNSDELSDVKEEITCSKPLKPQQITCRRFF